MIGDETPPYISIGPRVRKSPFFEVTRRDGAKAFTVYNHMYMPTMYDGPEAEFRSLVNDVTLWDVSCQRQVEISGPDAFELIQLLTPRDMSRCQVGQCSADFCFERAQCIGAVGGKPVAPAFRIRKDALRWQECAVCLNAVYLDDSGYCDPHPQFPDGYVD